MTMTCFMFGRLILPFTVSAIGFYASDNNAREPTIRPAGAQDSSTPQLDLSPMQVFSSIASTSATNRWLLSARNALMTLNRLASLPASLRWLATKASQAVITPVEPCRPVPTQLSLSLTRTMPANLRFACFLLAATSGSEQSVPPPPYFASRSAMLSIESFGSILAS